MRKLVLLLGLLLVALPAQAQQRPRKGADIYLGYANAKVDNTGHDTGHGLEATLAVGVSQQWSLVADFAYQTDVFDGHFKQYLAGLRYGDTEEQGRTFAHILAGQARIRENGRRDQGLAFVLGVGMDVPLAGRLGYRVLQLDYMPARYFDRWQHNFRFGTGILIFFGYD